MPNSLGRCNSQSPKENQNFGCQCIGKRIDEMLKRYHAESFYRTFRWVIKNSLTLKNASHPPGPRQLTSVSKDQFSIWFPSRMTIFVCEFLNTPLNCLFQFGNIVKFIVNICSEIKDVLKCRRFSLHSPFLTYLLFKYKKSIRKQKAQPSNGVFVGSSSVQSSRWEAASPNRIE